ncbi:fructosamine kinase family protein [Candidatus Sumerlaeota bacterium]|nr:fructosamine kinase family protein [Candidatus Sumerlaeota bacterium]
MNLPAELTTRVERALGSAASITAAERVVGGSISSAARIETTHGNFFLKWSPLPGDAFAREAEGLQAIAAVGVLHTPKIIAVGTDHLLLEYIPPSSQKSGFFANFGRSFAEFHRAAHGERYGFAADNYIGSTPQPNGWHDDWIGFFRERRLRHQLNLAARNGFTGELQLLGARLMDQLDRIIPSDDEPPTLLHGDLWSGNFLCDEDGKPVLIDPACYYGHREADLAMTRLFGGFPRDFYDSYEEAWPLRPGHEERMGVYTLYHLLNHANLFGGGYQGQCIQLMRRLLE